MPRRLLQQFITHEDFKEELAFLRLEPWLEEQTILYLAQLAALTAELHRDSSKKATPFTVKEFLFDFDPQPDSQEPIGEDRIEAIFKALAQVSSNARSENDGNDSQPSGKGECGRFAIRQDDGSSREENQEDRGRG